MFCLTSTRRWTPRYFSASRAQKGRRAKSAPDRKAGRRQDPLKHREPMVRAQPTCLSSMSLLADRSAALVSTVEVIPKMLSKLDQQERSDGRGDVLATIFLAKRDVLGPLALQLPPPPRSLRPFGTPARSSSAFMPSAVTTTKQPRLRLVPDDEVAPADSPAAKHEENTASHSDGPEEAKRAVISLEEAVLILTLFSRVESEDGAFLQQVLGEVDRFLTTNVRPLLATPTATASPAVVLPLPALLLALSHVGIAVEHTLEQIVRRPTERSRKSDAAGGVLYSQLSYYNTNALIELVVGLHRFGFHQHFAFEKTVKALQIRWRRPRSTDAVRLQHALRARKAALARGTSLQSDAPFHDDHSERSNAAVETLLQQVGLPDEWLVQDLRVFVEALTALSLSVFRRSDTVSCVADVFILNVLNVLNQDISPEEQHLISQLLHRAVLLCEGMELEQPLLAEVFGTSCSVSEKGIVFDGGEDTDDVPTERRAYYDHVTADLVKVNHV